MKVMVDLMFKNKDGMNPDRIYHLYFPADLQSDDGCLETKNMKLVIDSIESITVDCG